MAQVQQDKDFTDVVFRWMRDESTGRLGGECVALFPGLPGTYIVRRNLVELPMPDYIDALGLIGRLVGTSLKPKGIGILHAPYSIRTTK